MFQTLRRHCGGAHPRTSTKGGLKNGNRLAQREAESFLFNEMISSFVKFLFDTGNDKLYHFPGL